jgi:hypothetical protein
MLVKEPPAWLGVIEECPALGHPSLPLLGLARVPGGCLVWPGCVSTPDPGLMDFFLLVFVGLWGALPLDGIFLHVHQSGVSTLPFVSKDGP